MLKFVIQKIHKRKCNMLRAKEGLIGVNETDKALKHQLVSTELIFIYWSSFERFSSPLKQTPIRSPNIVRTPTIEMDFTAAFCSSS